MLEAGAQTPMPIKQSLRSRSKGHAIERSLQIEHQLRRVNIGRRRIMKRMEQQTLLQRRQRQDVLDLRVLALQKLDLCLRERNQPQIARAALAG